MKDRNIQLNSYTAIITYKLTYTQQYRFIFRTIYIYIYICLSLSLSLSLCVCVCVPLI